jgi:hypothetical protein
MNRLLAALERYGYYNVAALATIAVCAFLNLITAIQAPTLWDAVPPVGRFTACIAYGYACHEWYDRDSLVKLLFVVGALTSFYLMGGV